MPPRFESPSMEAVRHYASSEIGLCVVAFVRDDGTAHASVVNAGPLAHPVSGEEVVGFVVRSDAVKVGLARRRGRGSLTFRREWRWVGIEGPCDIIGPDEPVAGVDLPALLRAVFQGAGGSHDDWDEFDRVMADERRAAILVHPERIIGRP